MIIVKCDMCDADINYDYNGINCNFNHYGVVRFGGALNIKEEYQLCNNCAYRVARFIEMKGADDE